MRVNLTARWAGQAEPTQGTFPISLSVRPACGLPGDYDYLTDSAALLNLLRRQTDLPHFVLTSFAYGMRSPSGGRLRGVELSDAVLTEMGYFID